MNYFPVSQILYQKEEWVKFYEDMIIICEAMDREQIFGSIGNMKYITKMKIMSRVTNY
jgi:hypothetical protein